MKKLNSASKRKWVLGGILGFAAVALTTTGFATWIVGVNVTSDSGDVTVSVDTAQRAGIKMSVELEDNKIELKEEAVSSGVVTVVHEDTVTDPLKLVANVTITYGKDFDTTKYDGVTFDFLYGEEPSTSGTNGANLIDSEGNKIGAKRSVSPTVSDAYWEYVKAPGKINLTKFGTEHDTLNQKDGTYTHTQKMDVVLLWGSFFNNETPATYYNDLFTTADPDIETQMNNIVSELGAMHTGLNGTTLTLTAALTEKSVVGA